MSDCPTLLGKTILVVGGTKNIGLRIAQRADVAGARVVIAGRDADIAGAVASTLSHARGLRLDVTDEDNIASAAAELGFVEHIVVTAAAPHHAAVTELEHDKVVHAFETKVIGPLMLAKHFAPRIAFGGSMVLFSGVAAWKPTPGRVVTGVTNGAVAFAVSQLAKELAPVRVNAVSPGIIDRGACCDAMPADERPAFLDDAAAGTLAGHVGHTEHIADAVMWLLTASFVSGETIHVDGGARSS
jgi:NAD(P)-dependent dehydrogenase (short-subunit alcohol dehydrogenase family)